jgi:hypothetical protein
MISIYVQLLNEGTKVFRPVPSLKIAELIFELRGENIYNPFDEEWEFIPGDVVLVEKKEVENDVVLVAIKKVGESK